MDLRPPVESGLRAAKAAIRARMRLELGGLSAGARHAASSKLCERLRAQHCWAASWAVLLFAPLPDEPDIWPLVEEAVRAGKAVALPRFDPETSGYVPALVRDLNRDVRPGRYGIREPLPDRPPAALEQFDLVLVPGVAFDLRGRRVGRGKGYYDRLLPKVRGIKCGVAFEFQVVPEVPAGREDSRVDYLVTDSRWHEC